MKRRVAKKRRQKLRKALRQQWVHKRGCVYADCISKLVDGYPKPTLDDVAREYETP